LPLDAHCIEGVLSEHVEYAIGLAPVAVGKRTVLGVAGSPLWTFSAAFAAALSRALSAARRGDRE